MGSDINKINDSIKKIGLEVNLENEKMDGCLKNDKIQDEILTQRIKAQKKYKIEATPTILINEKDIQEKLTIKNSKTLEKILDEFKNLEMTGFKSFSEKTTVLIEKVLLE